MTESVQQAIKRAVRAAGAAANKEPQTGISPEERRRMIAEAAYYRAEQRGFNSTDSAEHDWLLAEQEIDALLASLPPGSTVLAH